LSTLASGGLIGAEVLTAEILIGRDSSASFRRLWQAGDECFMNPRPRLRGIAAIAARW
jgi:hypothetical protein